MTQQQDIGNGIVAKSDDRLSLTATEQPQSDGSTNSNDSLQGSGAVRVVKPPKHTGLTKWLTITSFIICFGSSLLFGYAIGVLNTPTAVLMAFYNKTYTDRGTPKDEKMMDFLWSTTVSIFVAVGMVGAFIAGALADKFGRKRTILFNHTFLFIGALLQALTYVCKAPEMLIVGRGFIGMNVGITSTVASLYLGEISPKNLRGAIGTCHQLAITIGILLSQVFGIRQIFGNETLWPYLLGIPIIPGIISCIVLPFCPESPRWLICNKNDSEEGRRCLVKLRGTCDVEFEMDELRTENKEAQAGKQFSMIKLFRAPEYRMPIIIAILLQVAQQWSGINAIFFYSEIIFKEAQLSPESIQYAILGTGVINVITTIISVPLCEKLGRRVLLIAPMIVMAVCCGVLTASINLQASADWLKYLSILCIIVYVIGFAIGLGPLPFVVIGEIFRTEARSTAVSVALFFNWTCNFILAMTFRLLQAAIGAYAFLIFMVVIIGAVVFIALVVPETKGKSIEDIVRDLAFSSDNTPTSYINSQSMLLKEGVRKPHADDAVKV